MVIGDARYAGLWEVVDTGRGDYRDDRNALVALLRAVPQEMQAGLARKETAKEAWEAIQAMRVGVERVKEANTEKLRKEFNELRFKAGVEDFSLRLNTLANQLRVMGEDISEKEVVKRLLHSVPESLEQVAISIETLLDLSKVSIEEAAGRLRAVEQRKSTTQSHLKDDAGRLLLTEEEWLARLRNQEGAHGGLSHGGRGGSGDGSIQTLVGSGAPQGEPAIRARHHHCTASVLERAGRGGGLEVSHSHGPLEFPGNADSGE